MKLHEQVELHKENLQIVQEEIMNLLTYLGSPKFQGVDNNYVNAREMYDRVNELRMMLTTWQYGDKISE